MAAPLSEAKLLSGLIEDLTLASGSAWQLCHQLQDPRFLPIRDLLDMVKTGVIDMTVMKVN